MILNRIHPKLNSIMFIPKYLDFVVVSTILNGE